MSDEPPRRTPPLTLVTDGDVSDTERLPMPPPPPRREPFRRLVDTSRPPTMVELAASVRAAEASSRETLALQRKLALEMDGLVTSVNMRFNVFHQELSLLRHDVVRVEQGVDDKIDVAIEEATPLSQRAKRAVKWLGAESARGTVAGTVLLLLMGLAARQWPWLGDLLKGMHP